MSENGIACYQMAKAVRVTATMVVPENEEWGVNPLIVKWTPENEIT